MKKFDFKKEEIRGSIKQLMTFRGLRMINLANYLLWSGKPKKDFEEIHSVKFDIMNGYINVYSNGKNGRAGEKIENLNTTMYRKIYNLIVDIFKNEGDIPSKLKRNILVRVNR